MNEPEEPRRPQFSIKSLLVLTLIAAMTLAMRARPPAIGAWTASMVLGVVGIPILLAVLSAWHHWRWRAGLLVLFVMAMLVTPADPYSMLVVAIPACAVYLVATLVWSAMQRRNGE